MITALGTKPNIFHAVRAMKPAHAKTQAPGNASLSEEARALSSLLLSQQPNSSSLGHLLKLGEMGTLGLVRGREANPSQLSFSMSPSRAVVFSCDPIAPLHAWMVLVVKNTPAYAGDIRDVGSILGSGRSSGEGHGNPLQYSCLENPVDRGA